MDRRQFLALSGAGLIGTAGCTSGGQPSSDSEGEATDTTTATRTETATSTSTSTATSTSDPYADASSGYAGDGIREAECYQFLTAESFRYYDSESESLTQIEPSRDWWGEAILHVRNLGGEEIPPPDPSRFTLELAGEEFQGQTAAPFNWDNLRIEGDIRLWWMEPDAGDREPIPPDEDESVVLFVDMPADPTPVVQWDSGDGTVRLEPGYVHEPGDPVPL